MKQSNSQCNSDKQSGFFQFFGKIDNHTYREFRVKMQKLATITGDRSVRGAVKFGLKKINDYHDDRILALENELRYHQQMKKSWISVDKASNDFNMELLARLLYSEMDAIFEFEKENFANDRNWTKSIKAKNAAELKSVVSLVRTIDEQGNAAPDVVKKREEQHVPNVSMSASTVCEDTSRVFEKLELSVTQSIEKEKDIPKNGNADESPVEIKNDCPGQNVTEKVSTIGDGECEDEDEKKDDEQAEKWSETTSLDPRLGNTDTCGSSLGSCEFEAGDEEMNSPRSTDNQSPPSLIENVKEQRSDSTESTISKKSNGNGNCGKGKKGRKAPKGPKMTLEEIEAIKKQKKDAADRAFQEREKDMQEHLDKVEKTNKQRNYRRVADTALQILKRGNGILPAEIKEVNALYEDFVSDTEQMARFPLREAYISTRFDEVTATILGSEQLQKINQLTVYRDVIERTELLLPHLAFLATLSESPSDFKEFEVLTVNIYLNGAQEGNEAGSISPETKKNFEMFQRECFDILNEQEKWEMAKEYVQIRLKKLGTTEKSRTLTHDEEFFKETFFGVSHLLEAYNQSTNVAAFLQSNRQHTSFNLMEAWLLESRRPPALALMREVDSD